MSQKWNLSEPERKQLIDQHSLVHRQLEVEVGAMSVSAWENRPDPDTWSAAEIVEHILLAEASLMRQVLERSRDLPQPDWEIKTRGKEEVLRRVLPGSGKAKAGASVTPSHGFALDQVSDALAQSQERLNALLVTTQDLPLKAILWNNRWFGDLSAYLWLLYLPLHGERHLAQLRRQKVVPPVVNP